MHSTCNGLKRTAIHFTDAGNKIPADLWRQFDFAIVTFDLTDAGGGFDSAWPLICDAVAQKPRVDCLSLVGTKWDLLSQDVYDTAVQVYQHARDAAFLQPGLAMYPVSSTSDAGLKSLSKHIGTYTHILIKRQTHYMHVQSHHLEALTIARLFFKQHVFLYAG